MKKKVFVLLGILILLVSTSLITSYADSARVRNSVEPKHTIKIVSDNGNRVTYWGLGYKVIRYPSVSPKEPYKNNRGVKYGSWFMKYKLPTETSYNPTKVENVELSICDISSTGATVTIKDTNQKPYIYGEWYKLEKENDCQWFDVKTIIENYGFEDIGYVPNNDGEIKFKIDWKWLYGELSSGHYRLLKQIEKQYISIEFDISI